MVAGMARGGYDDEIFCGGDVMGFGEGAAGVVEGFRRRIEDGGLGEMAEAVRVIEMPVGEEDGFDLLGADVEVGELPVGFVAA